MKIRYLAAALAVLVAAPAWAARDQRADNPYARMSDRELEAEVARVGDGWMKDSCTVGEPMFAELYRRDHREAVENGLLFAQTFCFDQKADYGAARAAFAKLEPRIGSNNLLAVGLYLDSRLNDADAVVARLNRFADEAQAGDAEALKPDQFYQARRTAHDHDREDAFRAAALRLFKAPVYAGLDSELQRAIAFSALKPAAASEPEATVLAILDEARDPASYPTLLAMRDYEKAWPLIERRVGEHFTAVTGEYRDWADARFENLPGDRDRFSALARALYYDGQFDKAAEMARGWRERQGSLEKIKEGDAWAFNIEAYALDAMGQVKQADAVFDQLAQLPREGRPWLVNFVINRASRLVGQKRFAEGLEAARLARTVADEDGSTYAKMLVAHDHACALYGLGRADEIDPELAYIRANSDAAVTVAAETLMCVGKNDEALALLLEDIRKPATRSTVIDGLLPDGYDMFYTRSALPDTRELLATSPELRAAYNEWAREIPERFVPAAWLKRAPLAQSRSDQAITP